MADQQNTPPAGWAWTSNGTARPIRWLHVPADAGRPEQWVPVYRDEANG